MGLQNTETIDFVMESPDGRGLDLVVFDDGTIADESRRYQLVLEKLITCVGFVFTGQYRERSPRLQENDVTIYVVCTTAPSDGMKRIVSMASKEPPIVRLPVIVVMQNEFLERTKRP